MGRQRSGTTLWQCLVSDFSLRTTTAFGSIWEGKESGEWTQRESREKLQSKVGEKTRSRGEERYGHGSLVLSSSRKVHWNSCSDSCHVFSCTLVSRVHLSAFTACSIWQKGRGLIISPAARNRFLAKLHISKWDSQYQLWIFPRMEWFRFLTCRNRLMMDWRFGRKTLQSNYKQSGMKNCSFCLKTNGSKTIKGRVPQKLQQKCQSGK